MFFKVPLIVETLRVPNRGRHNFFEATAQSLLTLYWKFGFIKTLDVAASVFLLVLNVRTYRG
ncbi:hypothetical protein CGI25_25335 [Vibrio parahaemolyticus]|nr:hypothetical protein CGI25_25335 [Vibrio parahaemolyticus]